MKSLIRALARSHHSSKVTVVLAAAFLFTVSSSSAVLAQLNFAPAVTYSSGAYYAISVAVADVNGDGNLDLVVANNCASGTSAGCFHGTVSVLLGNGDGTFQTAVAYDSGGSSTISVAVADVNGDGKPDILVSSVCARPSPNGCPQYPATLVGGVGVVGVLFGNGDGTFQTAVTYGSGGYGPQSVVVADVNRDGKPDLVVSSNCLTYAQCPNGVVGVLLNKGNGTFRSVVTYFTGAAGGGQAVVADVNSDGNPDIVVASLCESGCSKNGLVAVLFGNGDGTFQTGVTYDSGGWESYSVAVADVNGDNQPDIVVASLCASSSTCPSSGVVGVLLNNGDGTFQTAVTYGSGGYHAISVALGDVNGDGKPDIVVANISEFGANGTLGVLLNNGNGTFQTAMTYGSGGYGGPFSVAVADLNGDGKPDLVAANECVSESGCGGARSTGGMGVLINTSSCKGQYGVDAAISPILRVRKSQGLGGFAAECFY